MNIIKTGEMVKVLDRTDWPIPPGYKLANSEGTVFLVNEEEGFVTLRLEKTNANIPVNSFLTFRLENVEKL
jgi:hypothetical protein